MKYPNMKSFLGQAALEELQAPTEEEAAAAAAGAAETGSSEATSTPATGEAEAGATAAAAGGEGGEAAGAGEAGAGEAGAAGAAEGGEGGAAAGGAEGEGTAAAGAGEGGEAAAGAAGAGGEGGEAAAAGGEGGEGGTQPADAGDTDTQASTAAADAVADVGEPPVGEDVEGGDAAATVAEELADVEAAAGDLEDGAADIEQLQAATEHLTDVIAIVQASMQTGGMDPIASMLVRKHVSVALESLDQPLDTIMLPALEDAETPSAKIGMAGDAIDAIKKFLARIAKAAADGFVKFGEWIATIWTRLTDANKSIKARAEKLRTMIKGATMADAVTSGSVIKGLASINESNGFPKDPLKDIQKSYELMKFVADATNYKPLVDTVELLQVQSRSNISAEALAVKADEILSKMNARFVKEFNDSGLLFKNDDGGDMNASTIAAALPGLRVVTCVVPQNLKALTSTGSAALKIPSIMYSPKTESVPALTAQEADKLCAMVIDACEWNISNNANRSKSLVEFNATMKKSVDKLNELAKAEAEIAIKQGAKEGLNEGVLRFIANASLKLFNATPRLPGYTISRVIPGMSSAALDFVAASIRTKGNGEEGQKQLAAA